MKDNIHIVLYCTVYCTIIPNNPAGVQTATAVHSCYLCTGAKYDGDGEKVGGNKRGRWRMGDLRSLDSNRQSFEDWRTSTNGDRKMLQDFDSCHTQPMPLHKDGSKVVMGTILTFKSIKNL